MKKLNILMVSDTTMPDHAGGSHRYVFELSKTLVSKGHKVSILVAAKGELPEKSLVEGVTIYRYKRWTSNKIFDALSYVLGANKMFRKLCKYEKFDILHFHWTLPSYGVCLSKESKKIKKVWTYHAPWPRELIFGLEKLKSAYYGTFKKIIGNSANYIDKKVLLKTDHVHVLTEFIKKEVNDLHDVNLKKEIRIIPGGVYTEEFSNYATSIDRKKAKEMLNLDPNCKYIFTLRRLDPRMGIENLIRAIDILRNNYNLKHFKLLIGGKGPLLEHLKQTILDLNLEEYVQLLGFIPEEKVKLYYRAADLFVIPTEFLEGFGLVSVEAMASGTPVIGTPVGGIPEVISPFDPKLISDGIAPDELAKSIFENGLSDSYTDGQLMKYAQRYSWENVTNGLLEVYNS